MKVKDFLGKPAPAGYIAGLGRGATGFVTRPDIGPARDNIVIEQEDQGGDEEQFDENEVGLLGRKVVASGFNDPEDDEADRIYAEIDEKMAERRRSRRERQEEEDAKRQAAQRPQTQMIFADLKRDLGRVSEAEWAALPEVGDFRIKRLKRSGAIENPKERYLPVPDTIGSLNQITTGVVQDQEEGEDEADFSKIGEARGKLLGMHLDQIKVGNTNISASTSAGTSINDNTNSVATNAIATDDNLAQIGDLKRARQLFASIIKTNKKNSSGWISAARLELQAGNQKQARALILKGCEECPKSEELWSEAVKMHEGPLSREILAKALKNVPESISLWILAAERESEVSAKRKILRAALERNSSSSKLWMALVELEESEEDAKLLLTRAVECASDSIDLWLALARLQESTDKARQVLNRARLALPKSFAVWINAARLEEANDTPAEEIRKLLTRGAADLSGQGVELAFKDWQREAEECERGGDLICASELITIGTDLAINIDNGSIERIIEYSRVTEHVTCAKSALKTILTKKLDCKEAILLLIEKIKSEEDPDETELKQIYEKSLIDSDLWIMYARDFPNESRDILTRASQIFKSSEDQIKIWTEAIHLEIAIFRSNPSIVDAFVSKILTSCGYPELMIEVIKLYKVIENRSRVIEISRDGILKYPKVADFWIFLSETEVQEIAKVQILRSGLEQNPTSVKLALKIAEISNDFNSVQILLEKTRVAIQKFKTPVEGYEQLLVAIIGCNVNLGNMSVLPSDFCPYPRIKCTNANPSLSTTKLILNQSLKELPRSNLLWHLAVSLEPRQLRRSKVTEALKRTDSALLRWTLAMILEDKAAREAELTKAIELEPFNMDLRSFLGLPAGCTDLKLTSGANWMRFIDEYLLYFDPVGDSYDKFNNSK